MTLCVDIGLMTIMKMALWWSLSVTAQVAIEAVFKILTARVLREIKGFRAKRRTGVDGRGTRPVPDC